VTPDHSTSGRPDAPSGIPAHPTGGPPDAQAGIPAHLTTGPPDALSGIPAPPVPEVEAAEAGPAPGAPPTGFHKRPALGYALYLTGALLFGINGTVSKVLLTAVDNAARVSQLRVTFAFLILLVFVALTNRRSLPLHRHELGPVAAYGIFGVAMTQWLYFVAITRMPIGIALLIEFTAPIMVVLWVRYAWHRPVRNTVWLGLALAMVGLAMVAQIWLGLTLNSLGVAAAFGAAVALALYYLLGETCGRERDPVSLTLWGFGFAALLWAVLLPWWRYPWASLEGSATPLGVGTTAVPLWALAIWMIVLGTIVPFWLVLAAIRHIGAAGASIIGMTEPFIASLVAWFVLGEVLTPAQMLGGAVILAGVVIAERARS
jgi:drug/metabolite transporter (DMT)-like permease